MISISSLEEALFVINPCWSIKSKTLVLLEIDPVHIRNRSHQHCKIFLLPSLKDLCEEMTKTGFSLKSNNIINRASETKDRLVQGDNQLGHGGGDSDGDDDGDGVGCTICYW